VRIVDAVVPVELELAGPESASAAREVLMGEYDAPYFGERLRILDLGANIGAFSLWAQRRWPGSTITAYEPEPEAFALLERNTRGEIRCVNAAVYPTDAPTTAFVHRARAEDDEYGVLVLVNRGQTRLRRNDAVRVPAAGAPQGLREAVAPVPGLALAAARRRLRRALHQ